MKTEWICKECGQDSSLSSENCEICDTPRAIAEGMVIKGNHETFEIDGEQVNYVNPTEKDPSYGRNKTISHSLEQIVRTKKQQAL